MTAADIINHALNNLEKLPGIKGRWDLDGFKELDGCLYLNIQNQEHKINAAIKKEIRNTHIDTLIKYNNQYDPFVIIAARIFPSIKSQLQQNNIAYIEANGNLFFNKHHQFIWIENNPPIKIEENHRNRVYTKTGLKVVFEFLNQKDLIHQPYRNIATIANTAVGNVTNIIKGLKEEGYVLQLNKKEILFKNKEDLFNKWTEAYEQNLKPTLKMGNFKFVNEDHFYNWQNIHLQQSKTVWGGEPAGDLLTNHLRPEKLTLYSDESRNELMKNYKLVPDEKGNISVYKKFWQESGQNDENKTAPVMVVYADLITTNDKRTRETAKLIYERYIEQNL